MPAKAVVDVNTKDQDGWTPLHLAAANAQVEEVRSLLANAADVNGRGQAGFTVLHCAAFPPSSGQIKDVSQMVEKAHGDHEKLAVIVDRTHGILEVARNQPEVIQLLLAKGADVNAKDENGRTPLHLAARWANPEVIELLLAKGAHVNAKDRRGRTALSVAADAEWAGRQQSADGHTLELVTPGGQRLVANPSSPANLRMDVYAGIHILKAHGGIK